MSDVTWLPIKTVVDDLGAGAEAFFPHTGPTPCWQPLCTPTTGSPGQGCTSPNDAPRCRVSRVAHLAGARVALRPDGTREWQVDKALVWRIAKALNLPLPDAYPPGVEEPPQPIPVPREIYYPPPKPPQPIPLGYAPGKSPRQLANVATALKPIDR